MSLTEMLDNIPTLEEWMVPVYKAWERTAVPLRKYFYDISVFLGSKRIEHLFHMWPGVNITKDQKGLKFYVDVDMLDRRYLLNKWPNGQLFQFNKHISIPKPEIVMGQVPEKIWQKADSKANAKLEERVAELEKLVIKLQNQLNDK